MTFFNMTFPQMLFLFISAALGGILNSVAGGGSFFSFPALLFTGMPAIPANATSTFALCPASIASTGAYRQELAKQPRGLLVLLVGTSLIGGEIGALILAKTPPSTFTLLIPYLLLLATLLFTFSGPITARLRLRQPGKTRLTWPSLVGLSIAQLIISTYGGFFGGGIGILMLATLAMMGMDNIHEMNAIKTLLASCINGVAVITFITLNLIIWPQALLMTFGAILGGYGGAYYARKINPKWVRLFVIVVGCALTIYFFVRG